MPTVPLLVVPTWHLQEVIKDLQVLNQHINIMILRSVVNFLKICFKYFLIFVIMHYFLLFFHIVIYSFLTQMRHQVVAVGTALATTSLPVGAQQGPVMLTNKNLQCMRAILSMAHCHGGVLGAAWHLVLTTLQHLVWILGLKPSTGGSLKVNEILI